MIFWNQILITKSITKSAKKREQELKKKLKTLQTIRGLIVCRVKTRFSIEKGSTLFLEFEFSNILKIKPRIKNLSFDDPNNFKLTQKKDIDLVNHIGNFGKI